MPGKAGSAAQWVTDWAPGRPWGRRVTLRRLESSGLMAWHAYAEAPPRVGYELTELGRTAFAVPLKAAAG